MYSKSFGSTQFPLWERACSRKRCVCHINVGCADAFASKPAPTVGTARSWTVDAIVEASRRLSLTRCLQFEDEATSGWRVRRLTSRSSSHTTTSEAPTSGNITARASMMNTPVFQVGKS